MKEKRVSLDDIARAIGVSKATVSFVLNGKGDEFNISKEKQRLITEKARELQYVPNFFAKSLRKGATKTIGLVVADITNAFYAELCKTIQEALHDRGYNTFFVNTNDDRQLELQLMRELIHSSIDGMIIAPCNTIDALIPILRETHIPVVFADRPGDEEADFVGVDNQKEAHKLIASFSQRPRKVAAFVKNEEHISTILKRIEGIKEACEKDGIDYEIFQLPEDEIAVDRLVTKELMNGTDSFLPLNNIAAFQLIASFRRLLVDIPREVRLISFDDHPAFDYFYPPVSALRQPIKTMAEESVIRLVHRLDEKLHPGKHLLLSCEFIPRGTH